MKFAQVISCNDAARAVYIGTEKQARKLMDTLAEEHYKSIGAPYVTVYRDMQEYNSEQHWHIQTVKLLD